MMLHLDYAGVEDNDYYSVLVESMLEMIGDSFPEYSISSKFDDITQSELIKLNIGGEQYDWKLLHRGKDFNRKIFKLMGVITYGYSSKTFVELEDEDCIRIVLVPIELAKILSSHKMIKEVTIQPSSDKEKDTFEFVQYGLKVVNLYLFSEILKAQIGWLKYENGVDAFVESYDVFRDSLSSQIQTGKEICEIGINEKVRKEVFNYTKEYFCEKLREALISKEKSTKKVIEQGRSLELMEMLKKSMNKQISEFENT